MTLTIYGYVEVRPTLLRYLKEAELFWVPFLFVAKAHCRRTIGPLLFDCAFSHMLNNPYLTLFLMNKIDKECNIVETPPIPARKIVAECSALIVLKNLLTVANEVNEVKNSGVQKLYELVDLVCSWSEDMQMTSWLLFRRERRRIGGDFVREVSKGIAYKVVKSLLSELCIVNYKESSSSSEATASYVLGGQPVYALLYIKRQSGEAGLALCGSLCSNTLYSKLVEKVYTRLLTEAKP